MRQIYPKQGLSSICRLFGKTRQAYYDTDWHTQESLMEKAIIIKLVLEIREIMPRMGTLKLYNELKPQFRKHGIKTGKDALNELLAREGLLVRQRRRRTRTTFSNHWMRKYPNLIKDFAPNASEQLWVSDITYLRVGDGFSYLSLITDAYSRMIVGYNLSQNLKTEGCLKALEMALEARQKPEVLIHHSDRGYQYCSQEYTMLLKAHGIFISMTENGDPKENAIAERVNGILKTEFSLKKRFATHDNALQAVEKSINTYNGRRPHLSCNYLTPALAHKETGELKKHWKTYYSKIREEVSMT